MRYLLAIAALGAAANLAAAQCYDQYGRPRTCPNTPGLSQRGVINLGRINRSAAVQESYRDVIRIEPPAVNGKIRLEFWQAEPPDEILIEGRIWRRVR